MRILLSSYPFAPAVGGIETISLLLAQQWTTLGHDVTVVTNTVEEMDEPFPFEVVRRPDFKTLRRLIKRSDVYFQSNVSLQFLWAWLGTRKPLFIAHHTWLYSHTRAEAFRTFLKRLFIRRATSISVSHAIAAAIAPGSHVIANAYDDQVFHIYPGVTRDKDLVFVGRLIDAKGADVLLHAMHSLKKSGLMPSLTIIGQGPEEQPLRDLSAQLGLENQIDFSGVLRGEELAQRICAHRIMVVPSTWQEPFGIVALEGIACGCAIIGSSGGGLPDAIGPCGITFQNGNSDDLASVLSVWLQNETMLQPYISASDSHLKKHLGSNVARSYLKLFKG